MLPPTCTITWEAPAKGANTGVRGGYVDKLRYNVYRLVDGERTTCINGGKPLADDVLSTTYTLTNEDLTMTLADLSFGVEACAAPSGSVLKDLVSDETTTNSILMGKGKETPFFVDIANNFYKVNQKDFTIINSNNDDRFWTWCPPRNTGTQSLSGAVAASNYKGDTPMDDWFITPGIALVAGKTYHYRSYVHGPGANSPWFELGEVWIGTDRTAEAMTIRLTPSMPIVDYMYIEADFTVPKDGNYYFGTHSISEGSNWEIALFDIYVGENIDPEVNDNAPATAELAVKPIYGITETVGTDGQKQYCGSADIEITLPTRKVNGTALADSDLLDVTVTATDANKNQTAIAELTAQTKGATLELKAENLPSGMYTFSVQTTLDQYSSLAAQDAYVGWDNTVEAPKGMRAIHKGNELVVQFQQQSEPKGGNGAYLPGFSYRAYGGSKASQLSYYAEQGYTYVYDMIEADGMTDGLEITAPELDPNEGPQYNWLWYVAAVSKDAQGQNIYSKLVPVHTIIGAPLEAPVIETGNYEFIIDAEVDDNLAEVWNYYLNHGQVVCGVTGIDDQFGADYGQSWNIFSAFNGNLTTKFGKVAIADLSTPSLSFDIILEDTDTGMEVELNGPEGKQAVVPLTVMDGVQHINIPLDQYKSWGWVQPNLIATFDIANEGDRIHDIYVDNIGIYNMLPCNLAVTGVNVPTEMKAGEQAVVNVSVMNLGQQPVKNYTVTLIEDEVPVESQTFTRALQPGESNIVQFLYRANTVYADDIVGQEEAEKVLVGTVEIDGDANEDDNMGEATVTIIVTGGKKNTYPTDVVAQQMETEGVSVSWSFDFEKTSQVVTETFEDYETWYTGGVQAGAPEGQIGVWKLYDGDNKPTYTWAELENFSEYNGAPQAFQVFYGEMLLYSTNYYYWNYEAISGQQFLVSMDPNDGNYTPKPDDWLISPLVPGGSVLEFYYGALTSKVQGAELLYSETGQDINDFKLLKTLDDVNTNEWQFVYAKLPETAKYFAIHHNKGSYLGYGMKIDDITYNVMCTVDHFNIYVDGKLAGTSEEASYLINTPLEEGDHKIAVTAVYADGTESVPAYATIDYVPTSIRGIVTNGKPFDIYTTDGKLVRSNTHTTNGLKGVYIIDNRKTVLK